MADNATIFEGKAADKAPVVDPNAVTAPVVDPNNPLSILVGQGRKYASQEELAKAYLHLDDFAETLKGENTKLKEELATAKTLEEVLERLKDAPGKSVSDRDEKKGAAAAASLSAQDVAKIVNDTLTGRETARTRESNLLQADAAMRKLFGDKASEVFAKEATTPQLRSALTELASISPAKFVALFAPKSVATTGNQIDSSTSVNTSALSAEAASGRVADEGCKEFYDALRRKEPARFYSQDMQLKIHQAALANPDKYFGRKSS